MHYKFEGYYNQRGRDHPIRGEFLVGEGSVISGYSYDSTSKCPVEPLFGKLTMNDDLQTRFILQFIKRPIGMEQLSPIEYQLLARDPLPPLEYFANGKYQGAWKRIEWGRSGLEYEGTPKLWIPEHSRDHAALILTMSTSSIPERLLQQMKDMRDMKGGQ